MGLSLRLAWRNIWRQPRRTWLTVGAMVFCNVLLIFMISLQLGTYSMMIDNALQAFTGHLQVQAPGYKDDMKIRQVVPDVAKLAARIRDSLGLESVSARGGTFALASSEDRSYGIQVFGVDPEHESRVSSIPGLIDKGRYLEDSTAAEIVVGSVLARNLRVLPGDEIILLGSGRDGSFAAGVATIVGVFDSGVADIDRNIAEIPLGYFQDTFAMRAAGHEIVIKLGSIDHVATVKQQLEMLIPEGDKLVVLDWNDLQPGLQEAIRADMGSAMFIYAILVILVAFSVLNTQLMSVLERTHEFGVVISLGMKPGQLGRLVMLETLMLGSLGLLCGVLLGGLVTAWTASAGVSLPGMQEMAAQFNLSERIYPLVSPLTLLGAPIVVLLFTLIAALYPAIRLRWLQPVEAMRSI